jgi:hypothetical protein
MTINQTGPYVVFAKATLSDFYPDVPNYFCQLVSPNGYDLGSHYDVYTTGVNLMFASPSLQAGAQVVFQCIDEDGSNTGDVIAQSIQIVAIQVSNMSSVNQG